MTQALRRGGTLVGSEPWAKAALAVAVLTLGVFGFVYLQHALALVLFPYDWDQGEGYDAWSAWLIDRGQWPYSGNQAFPYYSSNYPPLWSYVVSIVMAWAGPGLASGRAVSTIAAVGCAAVAGSAVWFQTRTAWAGLGAAGLVFASPYVFHTTPLARVNALTVLFALLGVWAFERPTNRRLAWGTLALLLALFTKQTAADAAVACLGFVLLTRPRAGLAVSIVLGAAGFSLLAAFNVLTGGAFWLNVVSGNANPFEARQLFDYAVNFALIHPLPLALAAWEAASAMRRRAWDPWTLYFLASGVAALGVAKLGAGESYFLGFVASGAVLASRRLVRLLASPPITRGRPVWAVAALLLVAGQAVLYAHGPLALGGVLVDRGLQAPLLGRTPTAKDRQAGDAIVAAIRRLPGPALSEDPSFAVVAGRPVVANTTHLRNLYDAGLWDPTPLVADLQAKRYDTVVLNAQLYPQPVLDAIGRHYYLAQTVQLNGFTYQVFYPGAD
ncbi:MAG: hypothetical protein HYX52_01155 [Chloroflexi bacterium]|nr:hypothetical protein [Chloroflexota bacterium]